MPILQRDTSRYYVFPVDDFFGILDGNEVNHVLQALEKIRRYRNEAGMPERQYCVVSNKRPDLYEEVWGMCLAEFTREHEQSMEGIRRRLREASSGQTPTRRSNRPSLAQMARSYGVGSSATEIVADEDQLVASYDEPQIESVEPDFDEAPAEEQSNGAHSHTIGQLPPGEWTVRAELSEDGSHVVHRVAGTDRIITDFARMEQQMQAAAAQAQMQALGGTLVWDAESRSERIVPAHRVRQAARNEATRIGDQWFSGADHRPVSNPWTDNNMRTWRSSH